MKKIFLFIIFFIVYNVHAQNRQIDSLKELLSETRNDTSTFNVLRQISWNSLWSQSDTALIYAQKAMLLANKLNEPQKEAEALLLYGWAWSVIGNYPLAIDYLLKGLHVEEELKIVRMNNFFSTPFTPMLQLFYYALSETYKDQGDYERALYYVNKGKVLRRSDNDNNSMEAFLSLSLIYEKFNYLDSALIYSKAAYNLDIKANGRSIRTPIPLVLGNIYYKKKNYSLALYYYRIAQQNPKFEYSNTDAIDVYNGIAKTFAQINMTDSGIYYAQKALNLRKFISYPIGTINTYSLLASIYKKQGNSDSAIKYLEQTIFLRDTLFNQQKEREVQNLSFNEQLRKQRAKAQQAQFRNQMRIYILGGGLFVILIIAGLLWRNNLHKQKAYAILEKQKAETDYQRTKAEQTLEELKSTQAQLIQSEKMASLGQLTAGIAHEIQNPLNFVNNFSEVNKELVEELRVEKDNPQVQEEIINNIEQNLDKIIHHGKRADNIVKGMLQHSRASAGKKQPTNIDALVDECVRLSYHGMRAKDKAFNAAIKTELDESIGKINVVPQDISRVLLNLFNNAFYAVDEKKRQLNGAFVPQVSVCTKKLDGKVEIHVKDNGNGIPQNIIDKIFQPFFTTKPTGQGTGLGLSLSYDIIKAHAGEIQVESKEGAGTEFIMVLPLS